MPNSKKINLNDPTAWSEFDWSDPVVPEALKRTDSQVNVARSNRLQNKSQYRVNSYQVKSNSRTEVRSKISASLTGKKKSDKHNAKVAAKNKERSKVIITTWGEFSSRKAAVIWAKQNTDIINVDKKIQAWVKKPYSGFYYKEMMMKILEKATDILKDINADQLTTNAVIRDFDILTGINRSDAEEVKKIIGRIRTVNDVTPEIINNLISLHRK